MSILATAICTPVLSNGNPETPVYGLLAFARDLHAYRVQHDQKYRLEAARIRLEEERAEAARQTLAQEVSE
jgi:hypothetical protein